MHPKLTAASSAFTAIPNAAELTYYGSTPSASRAGERGASSARTANSFASTGMGVVSQIFNGDVLHNLVGTMRSGTRAIPPPAPSHIRNAQPLTVDCAAARSPSAQRHLTNARPLREDSNAGLHLPDGRR